MSGTITAEKLDQILDALSLFTGGSANEVATSTGVPGASDRGLVVRQAGRSLTDSGPWAYLQPATGLLSDADNLPSGPARGIRIIAAGDIKYETKKWDGATAQVWTETVTAEMLPYIIPAAVYKIWNTGTNVAPASIQLGL